MPHLCERNRRIPFLRWVEFDAPPLAACGRISTFFMERMSQHAHQTMLLSYPPKSFIPPLPRVFRTPASEAVAISVMETAGDTPDEENPAAKEGVDLARLSATEAPVEQAGTTHGEDDPAEQPLVQDDAASSDAEEDVCHVDTEHPAESAVDVANSESSHTDVAEDVCHIDTECRQENGQAPKTLSDAHSLKELRQMCKKRSLSAQGNKDELAMRLAHADKTFVEEVVIVEE